jgi:hypothetical protein
MLFMSFMQSNSERGRISERIRPNRQGIASMRKALPEKFFNDVEQSRLSMLRNWVLDHEVTEIEMSERQFWNFAHLQPLAEKPWVTFMGRAVHVPNMPEDAQKCIGIYEKGRPGAI